MALEGRCTCGNLSIHWQTVDFSVVPRACQCSYCREHGAAWVSKPGTRVRLSVRDQDGYRVVQRGSGTARFYECLHCGAVMVAALDAGGDTYGALNARHLRNPQGFAETVAVDYADQGAAEKAARWRSNWCRPVLLPDAGGAAQDPR